MRPYKVVIIICFLCSSVMSWGQRTAVGQKTINLRGGYTMQGVSFDASYFVYGQSNNIETGIGYHAYDGPTSTDERLPFADITAEGVMSWRVCGTYSRRLNIYVGQGLFLGYRIYDDGALSEGTDIGIKKSSFVYGAIEHVEAECYLTNNVALLLTGRLPISVPCEIGSRAHIITSLGIRVNL